MSVCLVIAVCWGATQPFLKKSTGKWSIFWTLINTSGSLLYYLTLQDMAISFAIPLIQGLSVVFNTIVSIYFDHSLFTTRTLLGLSLIVSSFAI